MKIFKQLFWFLYMPDGFVSCCKCGKRSAYETFVWRRDDTFMCDECFQEQL